MIGYFLSGVSTDVEEAWKLDPVTNPLSSPTNEKSLFSGPGLLAMQSFLHILAATPTPDQSPFLSSQGHARRAAQAQADHQSHLETLSRKRTASQDSPTDEQLKFKKVVQHERQNLNLKNPLSPPKKRPLQLAPSALPSPPPTPGPKSILKRVGTKELIGPLAGVEILRTASAKLNYLLRRIVELSREEKIIVFSDYAPMMWYLGEALEILGIEHLIYIQRLVGPPHPPW
jgi:hypothetical protein